MGPDVAVSLVEQHEIEFPDVRGFPDAVAHRGMKWVHLPIRDVSVPDAKFRAARAPAGLELRDRLQRGGSILVHCRGGLGRTGTTVELGMDAHDAIAEFCGRYDTLRYPNQLLKATITTRPYLS